MKFHACAISRGRLLAAILCPLFALPTIAFAQQMIPPQYRPKWPSGPGGAPSGKKLNVEAVLERLRAHNDAAIQTPARITMPAKQDRTAAPRPAALAVSKGPASAVLKLAASSEPNQQVAYLGKFTTAPLTSSGPILERELARQSLLIALRDELGLVTRDGLLGETAPQNDKSTTELLRVEIDFSPGSKRQLTFRKPGETAGAPFAQFDFSAWQEIDYPKFFTELESMTRKKLPPLFKALNVASAAAPRWNADAPLDPEIEPLIQSMNLYSEFEAIRRIHASIRKDGESRAALDALVRAYANLAILSEFHWTAAHKACLARALLYSQRLLVKDQRSSWSLRRRAYAFALAGRHELALADLANANVIPDKNAKALPAWNDVLVAFCRFDMPALEKLSEDESVGLLAGLLRYLQIEDESTLAYTMDIGRKTLRKNPECFRIADGLCEIAGVSDGHQVTVLAPAYFYKSLNDRLKALPDLPMPVRDTLPAGDLDAEAVLPENGGADAKWNPQTTLAALRAAAPSSGEFSWAVLGHLLEETQFKQIWRRVHFLRFQYGLGAEEYVAAAMPLIEQHPYRDFIDAHAMQGPEQRAAIDRFLQALDAPHAELFHEPTASRLLFAVGREVWQGVLAVARGNCDVIHRDYVALILDDSVSVISPRDLLAISPHSNVGRAGVIRRQSNKTQLAELLANANGDPIVLTALGARFKQLRDTDNALKCLEQLVELSPDYTSFTELAEIYKDRKEMEKWRDILDKYINEGRQDLMTAKAQTEIAAWLLSEKKLDEAAQYADAAAESWAQWAMLSALAVAKAQHDYPKARMYLQRLLERYPCEEYLLDDLKIGLRLSREDFQRAATAARPLIFRMSTSLQIDIFTPAMFLLLIDEHAKALALYRKIFEVFPVEHEKVYTAFFILLLEDQLDHTAERDKMLAYILSTTAPREAKSREFAKLLQAACAEGGALDLVACDKILADGELIDRVNLNYFLAFFLQNRNRPAEARPYLVKTAEIDPDAYFLSTSLALRELQRKGIPVPKPSSEPEPLTDETH